MNYRIMFVLALLCLAACNDSNVAQTESTFVPPQVAPPVNLPKVDPGPVIQLTDLPLVPVAPADAVLEDKNTYSGAIGASLELATVSEAPAVKNHQMTLKNGETISYTARAGHLIAYAPQTPKLQSKRMPKRPFSIWRIRVRICPKKIAL
jgi:hypothetical protein